MTEPEFDYDVFQRNPELVVPLDKMPNLEHLNIDAIDAIDSISFSSPSAQTANKSAKSLLTVRLVAKLETRVIGAIESLARSSKWNTEKLLFLELLEMPREEGRKLVESLVPAEQVIWIPRSEVDLPIVVS